MLRVICGLGQRILSCIVILLALQAAPRAWAAEVYTKRGTWVETLVAARAALAATGGSTAEQNKAAEQAWFRLKEDFPVEWDWALQDGGADSAQWFRAAGSVSFEGQMIDRAMAELGESGQPLRQKRNRLAKAASPGSGRQWLELLETLA